MLITGETIETIYYLYNPLNDISFITTETNLHGRSEVVQEVFGIPYIEDLPFMLCHNEEFRKSICKEYDIMENEISLSLVFWRATEEDLMTATDLIESNVMAAPHIFGKIIRLEDGIYRWNKRKNFYEKVEIIYKLE